MSTQRLFDLQLHVKRNSLNRRRNEDEVRRYRDTWQKQVTDLMSRIYNSIRPIWHFLFTDPKSVAVSSIEFKEIPISTNKTVISETSACVKQIWQRLPELVNGEFASSNSQQITLECSLFLMAAFDCLWSQEKIDFFMIFMTKIEKSHRSKLHFCLFLQPLSQIYLRYCTGAILENISKPDEELCEAIKMVLTKAAPLIPHFLRSVFIESGSEAGAVFWNSFLYPTLRCAPTLGIIHPEMNMKIDAVKGTKIQLLEKFFASEEGNNLILSISKEQNCVAKLPTEKLLKTVHPKFQNPKIFDQNAISAIVNASIKIPTSKDSLYFIEDDVTDTHKSFSDTSAIDPLCIATREFLLHTKLFKLSSEKSNTIEYFREIAELSTVDGDALIEKDLEALTECLEEKNLPITDLCDLVEASLKVEEDSSGQGVLGDIATYSNQNLYLTKLTGIIEPVSKNARNECEFHQIAKFVAEADQLETPIIQPMASQVIEHPEKFVEYYKKCAERLPTLKLGGQIQNTTYRNLFSVIIESLNLIEYIDMNMDELKEKDRIIHKLLSEHKSTLLEHQPPDYIAIFENENTSPHMFLEEFRSAFAAPLPFARIMKLHTSFLLLLGVLVLNGEKEIGGDQMVPFTLIGTVNANPMGLATTAFFIKTYLKPFECMYSPMPNEVLYDVTQFLACYEQIEKMAKEHGLL